MYRILTIAAVTMLMYSCSETPVIKKNVTVNKVEPVIEPEDTFNYDTLQGMYVGDFGGSDIRIILNYISKKNAIGYNIHKGLQRNITGLVNREEDKVQLIMEEPGDNEYDGTFIINFNGIDTEPTGSWVSNSSKISKKEFKLKKIIKPKDEDRDVITITNFATVYSELSDSIGDYYFKDDGLCILEYYNDSETDEERLDAQLQELKGTWSLAGSTVTINWEANEIFKDRKLTLEVASSEYGEPYLKGKDDHRLWMMYGW